MPTAYQQSGKDYLPRTDSGLRDWLINFASLIADNPGRYGLDSADADVITNQSDAYDDAYQESQAPTSRTSDIIARKDALRASAVASVRVYARMIKANMGVSNEDKIALGLHVDDPTRTPIPAPTTAPLLMITGAFSGTHELRYADETTPASRRKPEGVMQLQLSMVVGDSPSANPEDARLVGLYTKQPITIEHDPEHAGQVATFFGRWVTRKGLVGPWSLPEAMTIAFGGAGVSGKERGRETSKPDLRMVA